MDNKNKTFAVQLPSTDMDPRGFYKKGLIDELNKYPWLTVAGMDDPFYTKSGKFIRGINYAGPKNLITFGTAKNHDVNWIEREDFARTKGVAPVYDIIKDWSTVKGNINAFAAVRKPAPKPTTRVGYIADSYFGTENLYINDTNVEVFSNYFKIGSTIIPRTNTTSTASAYKVAYTNYVPKTEVTVRFHYIY